jgi:hypothetical protein
MKPLAVVLVALLLNGCGPFVVGTWKDDPKNWKRYFRESQPKDIVVRHSYYWRSPQPIFLEFTCFFEIDDSKAARSYLGFSQSIRRTTLKISDDASGFTLGGESVPWFPTRSSSGSFEIWRPESDRFCYVVVVDLDRRRIFITDRM